MTPNNHNPKPRSTKSFSPAEAFPVGEYIRDELEARDWNIVDLARIMDVPLSHVELVVSGGRKLTVGFAEKLGMAFAQNPETWLRLNMAYRQWLTKNPAPARGDEN